MMRIASLRVLWLTFGAFFHCVGSFHWPRWRCSNAIRIHRPQEEEGFVPVVRIVSLPAVPITMEEAENWDARVKRAFRTKPFKILRPRLSQDFAILLMRSSYNVLDELDCVAMDQFQRDFFLIRQAEYQPYVDQLGAGFVQQGDLTNPYYVRCGFR